MWNDTDVPLAHLITFRCYGTWLHGDERGSIDRHHNLHKSPYLPRSEQRQKAATQLLKFRPVLLDAQQREEVNKSVREVCKHRRWHLHALNVRTNHVHVVAAIGSVKPERALNAFKAYATRALRKAGFWTGEHSPWADRGSKRHLWNEKSVALAIDYVLNGQGGPLPDLD